MNVLLGRNAPLGHAVDVVQHPEKQLTTTDRLKAAFNDLLADKRAGRMTQLMYHQLVYPRAS